MTCIVKLENKCNMKRLLRSWRANVGWINTEIMPNRRIILGFSGIIVFDETVVHTRQKGDGYISG